MGEDDYKISINVRIGDRIYPMRVRPSEEEHIRSVAKYVTDTYNNFAYKLIDPMDRMAHVAFNMARNKSGIVSSSAQQEAKERLQELGNILESELSE